MKVLKFGGTSVGSPENILNVKKIVESQNEPVVVVVSALGGVTDQLLRTAQTAARGDASYTDEYEGLVRRHHDMIDAVIPTPEKAAVIERIKPLLDELGNILKGIYLIKDLSPKSTDIVLSYGEGMSSIIASGLIAGSQWFDARKLIKTWQQYTKHIVDFELTNSLIHTAFEAVPRISVVPGFISSDRESGETTNLGRGGSDYTAAILAACLKASQLEIWTDVDGFMTADPRVINNAYVIDKLTFIEAMELSNFGAKVIYPPTIFPVFHANIPIVIKNTMNPTAPGTYIAREVESDPGKAIKGISSINDTCLITVMGLGMVGVIGVNYRIFKALANAGISVFFVSQASSENTTSIGVKNADSDKAIEVLEREFAPEIKQGEINRMKKECGLATVAIVGENMKRTPGIAGKLFGTLGRNGINVIACAQGASETNISFVITLESLRKALNVIHDSFFLSDYQVLNVFLVGVGLVGSSLLEQIRKQREKLQSNNALKINVVGIANSRKFIVNREGIDLTGYRELLQVSDRDSSPEGLRDEIIGMNIFNSVFVDCTASPQVASIYKELLEHNVSVVTANKVAASAEYEKYAELKQISRKRGAKFLFETNVGAGLPVINTIGDLINSGDHILKIEAVVSGTLNYIFNVMSETVPMSRAIRMAMEAGYAEPDPRIDLSGMDVLRKLVILSREAGYRIEQADVERHLFVPQSYFEGTLDDFWKNIEKLDAGFEARRKELAAEGKRLRFVACYADGKAEIGLREVDSNSPFYHLEGSNNVILLTTERYNEYPLQIKGYGAGASVTAAGVFADIISIANIR
ncbi:MAG: bifunctional aspartate kinase/homoserine dehydrogenase I [Rikenellaceae bacterium]|jgi:aspartokinase/homoserine dehydrogenase 1|nr:bifunctional aspartate kinase/homoserine dehydrogenase I [Rikenellaceae bacterium]